MDERRKAERYQVAYPIEPEETLGDNHVSLQDVSRGGAAFTANEGVHEDAVFDLKLFLKRRMFKLRAMVVWQKQVKKSLFRIGVKFTDPPEEFASLLQKEIEEIIEYHRESNLYKHENLSFSKASREYLEGFDN